MRLEDRRVVVFDLETGGLDPNKHPVIQYAAVAVDGLWREVASLEVKVQFREADATAEALALNSYDFQAWKAEAVPASRALEVIGAFNRAHATVEKRSPRTGAAYSIARVCAHNAAFDTGFLSAWFKRERLFLAAGCFEPLDTLSLARWVTLNSPSPPENHKLGTLCAHFGIEHLDAHDALSDVRATAQLARVLLERIGGLALPEVSR